MLQRGIKGGGRIVMDVDGEPVTHVTTHLVFPKGPHLTHRRSHPGIQHVLAKVQKKVMLKKAPKSTSSTNERGAQCKPRVSSVALLRHEVLPSRRTNKPPKEEETGHPQGYLLCLEIPVPQNVTV